MRCLAFYLRRLSLSYRVPYVPFASPPSRTPPTQPTPCSPQPQRQRPCRFPILATQSSLTRLSVRSTESLPSVSYPHQTQPIPYLQPSPHSIDFAPYLSPIVSLHLDRYTNKKAIASTLPLSLSAQRVPFRPVPTRKSHSLDHDHAPRRNQPDYVLTSRARIAASVASSHRYQHWSTRGWRNCSYVVHWCIGASGRLRVIELELENRWSWTNRIGRADRDSIVQR